MAKLIEVRLEEGPVTGIVFRFFRWEFGMGVPGKQKLEQPKLTVEQEEPELTAEQQQARLNLINAFSPGVEGQRYSLKVTNLAGASLRSGPRVSGVSDNVVGWLEEGDRVFAIEFWGEDPTNPKRRSLWFAFKRPGDTSPLEKSQVVLDRKSVV